MGRWLVRGQTGRQRAEGRGGGKRDAWRQTNKHSRRCFEKVNNALTPPSIAVVLLIMMMIMMMIMIMIIEIINIGARQSPLLSNNTYILQATG